MAFGCEHLEKEGSLCSKSVQRGKGESKSGLVKHILAMLYSIQINESTKAGEKNGSVQHRISGTCSEDAKEVFRDRFCGRDYRCTA